MMSTGKYIISKIRSITIEDFAGFIGKHKIDTDADLVLIAGPNGYGKSSFLKAILFVLTGHLHHNDSYDDIAGIYISKNNKKFTINAEVEIDKNTSKGIDFSYNEAELKEGGGLEKKWANKISNILQGYQTKQDDSELRARVCGFFQEYVESLFDETTRGRTIRDFFEPLPAWLAELEEYLSNEMDREGKKLRGPALKKLRDKLSGLKKLWEENDKKYQQRLEKWPDDVLQKDLQKKWTEFNVLYNKVRPEGSGWPDSPKEADIERIDYFIRNLGTKTGKYVDKENPFTSLKEILADEIKREIRNVRRKSRRTNSEIMEISDELSKLRGEIEQIEKVYPNLDEQLAYFSSDTDSLPGLDDIFESLSTNVDKWKKAGIESNQLARVMEETRAVVAEEASKCAQLLQQWIEPRKEAKKKLSELKNKEKKLVDNLKASEGLEQIKHLEQSEKELKDIVEQLNRLGTEQKLRKSWQEALSKREPLRKQLDDAIYSLEEVAKVFADLTSPSKELLESLAKAMNDVLCRFNLTEGIWPVKLEEKKGPIKDYQIRQLYAIQTKDGRKLYHLSTGQKVQMAVAMLVGQNLLLNPWLHHRVILLDDVTTAYDLSNLTREAILWRQLVYGNGSMRRQIFISSHHEDLTNQLLDLLIPPKGRSMRLIRFTDWNNEKGPEFEQFGVEPTGSIHDTDYSMIKNNLIQNIGTGPWK
ncbi:MAG: AAA family ATPase [Nitrospiraceae bacterium]|nr:AAA family ATPase [Nitrospiraceae bacterium]